MKHFILLWLLAPCSLLRAAPPNVLLIVMNGMNTDLGCYGSPIAKTPHLDALAARGVRFNRAYTPIPMYQPGRVCLLTGLRPDTLDIIGNSRYTPELPKGAQTIGHSLKEKGWFTLKAGHVVPGEGYPTAWDDAAPLPPDIKDAKVKKENWVGVPSQTEMVNGKPEPLAGIFALRYVVGDEALLPEAAITADAIAQIQRGSSSGKPFFLAVGYNMPALGAFIPKRWLDLFADLQVPPDETHARTAPAAARFAGTLTERPPTEDERRRMIVGYHAMTAYMDAQVGSLLAALDQHKLRENTIILFTSSAGFHLGDHGGLWSWRSLFDRSCRVPLILSGPGITATNQASPRVVSLIDLHPTLHELLALPKPKMTDGTSFVPLLKKPDAPWDGAALSFVLNYGTFHGRAIRTEHASHIQWGAQNGAELYNLTTDPNEQQNLIDDKASAAAVKKMQALLAKKLGRR